jgi:hypothetical protein
MSSVPLAQVVALRVTRILIVLHQNVIKSRDWFRHDDNEAIFIITPDIN